MRGNGPTARELGAPFRPSEETCAANPHDPHSTPDKQMHLRLNAWEHEQLQLLARRLDTSLQRAARAIIRQHLLGEPRQAR